MGTELPEGFPDMGDLPDGVKLVAASGSPAEVLMQLMDLAGPAESINAIVAHTAGVAHHHAVNCTNPKCPYEDAELAFDHVFEGLARAIELAKETLRDDYLESVESARFEKEVSSYLDTIEVAEPDRPEPTDPAA